MKRLLIFTTLLFCSLLSFAQFSGTVSDSQGVKYTANNDESTCYVSGHESNFSATIVIPESYEGRRVTSIGSSAFDAFFDDCSGLTSVTIPNSVTSIGKGAFYFCTRLASVTIPSSIINIGEKVFMGCTSLSSVIIPNSVSSIGYDAFSGCSSLSSVVIGSSVTNIDAFAFGNCPLLTNLYCYAEMVPNSSTAFYNSNIKNTTLHVPSETIGRYGSVRPWNEFKSIVALTENDPKP